MDAFYADHFVLPLPQGHRFPMHKYALLHAAVAQQLPGVRLREAPAATDGELALAHLPAYVTAVQDGSLSAVALREIGFPWSAAMAERARRSVGGTLAAVQSALATGVAGNLAGGTHHAYADKGGGFCVFNDVAVAARWAQAVWARSHREPLQVAVIDLDVHQGNGTAHIFRDDASVFTLSLHAQKNFPFRKEASDLDVGLPDDCGDADYLDALQQAMHQLAERCQPGLILYLAGADPFVGDRLGRLALSPHGLAARDRCVLEWAWARRIPLAFVMAGGYGVKIEETVAVQLETYRTALAYWQRWQSI